MLATDAGTDADLSVIYGLITGISEEDAIDPTIETEFLGVTRTVGGEDTSSDGAAGLSTSAFLTPCRCIRIMTYPQIADVAELADAQVSEACDGDIVEVQVLSSAPKVKEKAGELVNRFADFYVYRSAAQPGQKKLPRNLRFRCFRYKRSDEGGV
jgi:hypothetical protein